MIILYAFVKFFCKIVSLKNLSFLILKLFILAEQLLVASICVIRLKQKDETATDWVRQGKTAKARDEGYAEELP